MLRIVESVDVLIEGFRPGVMERLGLGPEACLERNPRLLYGRASGWGQDGPYAAMAGHDLNYIAVAGVLGLIGTRDTPVMPLNLLGDFAGGGMLLALGIAAALVETRHSGKGQVIDAAMVDGAALLSTFVHGVRVGPGWGARGSNILDGGSHFYNVYECADGRYLSVAAVEPQFYATLVALLGLPADELPDQLDPTTWPAMRKRFAEMFRTRTRDEWCSIFDGTDACCAAVLDLDEVMTNDHLAFRGTFVERDGVAQPSPAPRFSRTPAELSGPPADPGEHTDQTLVRLGFSMSEVDALRACSAVR